MCLRVAHRRLRHASHARLNAEAAGKLLLYIPAVDLPVVRMVRADYDELCAAPSTSTTTKLLGILPLYVGMEVILTESYLPPKVVRGASADVVGIEFHPREPPLAGRATLAAHGCVLLEKMPK